MITDEVEESAKRAVEISLETVPELKEEVEIHLSSGRSYFEIYTALRTVLYEHLSSGMTVVKRELASWFEPKL